MPITHNHSTRTEDRAVLIAIAALITLFGVVSTFI